MFRSIIGSSVERINLDPSHPYGEHMTFTTFGNNVNNSIEHQLKLQREQRIREQYRKIRRWQQRKKDFENRSSQHSDLDGFNDSDSHAFWKLFPYEFRKDVAGKQSNCNYYFIRGDYLRDIADLRENHETMHTLKGLTMKEFRIMIEEKLPNALNECATLKDLFENGQWGDAVDTNGYRGHGLYILGFDDLSMREIQHAYDTKTEQDYLKLMKTFDYGDDHWRSFPMEVGDAPYNYYVNTPLREGGYRWIDPSRIWNKGVVWKKCLIQWQKFNKDGELELSDYIFAQYDYEYDECQFEWIKKPANVGESGLRFMKAYTARFDDACPMRFERIKKCLMQSLGSSFDSKCASVLTSFLL